MENIAETCGNIKGVLESLAGSDLSSTARLVATLEACGITDRAEIERLTGSGQSTIRRAKSELREHKAALGNERSKMSAGDTTAQNRARPLENERSKMSAEPRVHSRIETPSGLVISKVEVKNPPTPKSAERVEIVDGRLVVCDDLRKFWISELDGDEKRFNLALIEIGDSLQPNSRRPLESQLGSRMARIAADKRDRDARYRSAVKTNAGTRAAVDQRREDPYHIAKVTGPRNLKPAPGSDHFPELANA